MSRPPKSGTGRPPRGGSGDGAKPPADRRPGKAPPSSGGEGAKASRAPRRGAPRGRSDRDDTPPVALAGHGPGRKARPDKSPRALPADRDDSTSGERRPPRGRGAAPSARPPRRDAAPAPSDERRPARTGVRPDRTARTRVAEAEGADDRRPPRSGAPRRDEAPAASTERRPPGPGLRPGRTARARLAESEDAGERRPPRSRGAAPAGRPPRREDPAAADAPRTGRGKPPARTARPRPAEGEDAGERRPSRSRSAAPAGRPPRREDPAAADAPRTGRGKPPARTARPRPAESEDAGERRPPRSRSAAPAGRSPRREDPASADAPRTGRGKPRAAGSARPAESGAERRPRSTDAKADPRRSPRGKPAGARARPGADKAGGDLAAIPEWLWDGGEEPVEEIVPDRRRPRGRLPSRSETPEAPPEPAPAGRSERTRPSVARALTSSRKVIGDAPRHKSTKPEDRWRDERRKRPAPEPDQARYIVFHKPYGVLSQFTPEGRWRGLNEFGLPPGIYAAGRLDADSEGLLLLTDDGPLIKRLLDPKHGHPRTYLVQVEGEPADEALDALAAGIALTDGRTKPCLAERLEAEPELAPRDPPIRFRLAIPTTWLRLTLTEGRNRQVRRMTAAVGHPTLRLVRVAIGGIELADLPPGAWIAVDREMVLPTLR